MTDVSTDIYVMSDYPAWRPQYYVYEDVFNISTGDQGGVWVGFPAGGWGGEIH